MSDFYSPSIGGTQILAESVCEGFRKKGFDVSIITSKDKDRKHEQYEYEIHEVETTNFFKTDFFLKQNYDSVIVFADLFSFTIKNMSLGEIKNSILVLNLDENVYQWYKEGRIQDIDFLINQIKKFDTVISFCQEAPVNKFLDENKIDYMFIPNFSRDTKLTEKIDFSLRDRLSIGNKKIIFNHGLIEERKNQLHLCKAYSESSLIEDYVLVFLGSPRSSHDNLYYKNINAFIEEKSLKDNIKIIKGTNKKKIIDSLLNQSDVYVLPSKAEGLPLVLLEAMSADIPWISTPVGGVPSVFGKLSGGVVLKSIDFTAKDLEEAVKKVEHSKSSREEWLNTFTEDKIINKYIEQFSKKKTSDLMMDKKISFANQVYNEEKHIAGYLQSCLQFSDILDEVFIINHRSTDNTLSIIESFKEQYDDAGITLNWMTEKRDFSKDFTIADLFGNAVSGCSNEIVFRHDADFIFGSGYRKTIRDCLLELSKKEVYACGYEIPVVSEKLNFEGERVSDFGFCKMHVSVPRVFKKSKTKCIQNHVKGKYEWFYPMEKECTVWKTVQHYRESVLSVNIKDEQRTELRKTMNTFFEDIYAGKVTGEWLDNKNLRKEDEEQNREDANLKSVDILGEKYIFEQKKEVKFIVTVPFYNVENYIERCIDSIKRQTYKNYVVILTDDNSSDRSLEIAKNTISDDNRFMLVQNQSKKDVMENTVNAINMAKPNDEDIIVNIDGDDWLIDEKVFEKVANIYNEKQILMTYGNYKMYPSEKLGHCSVYPDRVIENNLYRKDAWRASHLRTYKYKLWKNVKEEDLKQQDGTWIFPCADQAYMLPMLEMSGGRFHCFLEPLYIYNRETALNADKVKGRQQKQNEIMVRSRKPYNKKIF